MEILNEENQAKIEEINQVTHTFEPSRSFNSICYDDDKERTIPLSNIISQLPSSIVITTSPPILPIEDPDDSLIMGNEDFNTILEKESDEFIKFNVKDLVPIPSLRIHLGVISKVSYDSNLDEPTLLVTHLFDATKDECFDPGDDIDEIDAFLEIDASTDIKYDYHDLKGDILYLKSLFNNDIIPSLPSEVFLDHDTKSLKDESVIDDSKNMVKIYDPGILEKNFSPTYVSLPSTDRHYLFFTYVV
uniref:Reverse transcriptase domain-containing protein n=1 Tax=Tanacetum cinerariifolium TaxID=118510 RepID=A0A699GHN4_TANCI|nr:hypothetical protein [Tanacetum cinerariifolium]